MNFMYQLIQTLLPVSWLEPAFMKNAFLAILVACPLFGVLGTVVVANRMAFFSDAIGHSALTGIALGMIAGVHEPTLAMVLFSLVLGCAIILVKRNGSASADTVIGVFSATAVALGIVLLSSGGSFSKYQRYLVGDILSIQPAEIALLLGAFLLAVVVWIFFFNHMLLATLHTAVAHSRGIKTGALELLFALLVAGIVTVSIRWTGLLVINSLLVLPAATSRALSKNTARYIGGAVVISLVSGIAGLVFSYYSGAATGASIVLMNAVIFLFAFVYSFLQKSIIH